MANQTILNMFSKMKTLINNQAEDNIPKYTKGNIIDNKYRVLDKLSGISGEADLYKVTDCSNSSSSELVLKLYRRKDSVKEQVVSSLKQIKNKNVAEIIDNGNISGYSYIVMPFYACGSLASLIEQNMKFSVEDLKLFIIPSIVEGLNAVHKVGIIHKDLKPSNLMISNDQNSIVLIDFGISSATNGNTVVVTQTGKSPFYSAPETTTGVFLTESDYYSLGITLYELVTGTTPYQNANIENIARFAQIQQIPYPGDFDKELADLIDGLTYKDISYRNDKSNPNRRWGYEEVQKWLRGEKQVKPGSSNINQASIDTYLNSKSSENNNLNIPYMFKGNRIFDHKSIISTLLFNWYEGKKDVFRGILSRYYEQTDNTKAFELCQNTELLLAKNKDNDNDNDVIFFDLMYKLEPTITELYWKGDKFENLQGYGNALIDEVLNGAKNKVLLKSATDLLKNDVLLKYINYHKESINPNFVKLIQNNKKLLETSPLDDNHQALRLGYALTGREDFKIGGKCFNTIQEWNKFLDNMYNEDIVNFVSFCNNNKDEIELQKKLFSDESVKAFTSKILNESNAIILGKGKYCFRNTKEIQRYTNKLWEDKKFQEFAAFKEQCKDDLKELEKTLPKTELNDFKDFNQNSKNLFFFDEWAFPSVQDFIEYIQNLQALYKPFADRFLRAHSKGIQIAMGVQSKENQQLIQKKLDIKYLVIKGNISVGNYVKFGNYWQSNNDTKEPIEWLVLDVEKGKKALLLSKYALDCKPYHHEKTSITWENCDLRKWLNTEFINNAFSEDEKDEILLSNITNNNNNEYDTYGGNDTKDKVFLLSIDEVNKYFINYKERQCKPTQYAVSNNAYKDGNGMCWWRLRSLGSNQNNAAHVSNDGNVNYYGSNVNNVYIAVRVALWVNL